MSTVFEMLKKQLETLDADGRDQLGTLLVALFVGALATLARVMVHRRNRWWLNMCLVHGVIALYWWNQCHLNEPNNRWLTTVHSAICWKYSNGKYQQILWWGGDSERFWVNVLVWLAVLGNVVPAYATGNEAGRHMTHVKRRACNPLVNHIIAGILCVCFPYFVVTWKVEILVPVAVIFDLYHQITIHRLIANHDGIWVLRAVSMSLAITKWIVILNMWSSEPWNMLDQIFIMSTGFLGTRAYGALAFLAYYAGLGDIKTAQWYSIGLMTASMMIFGRFWGLYRITFWLTIVNCSAMHYHQMWKKFINLRPHFVGLTAVLTVIVTHSGIVASLLFTIVWSFGNFILPHFNRFRPAPKTDFTPSVTPAVRMLREMSGRLSARLRKAFTPGGSHKPSWNSTRRLSFSSRARLTPMTNRLSRSMSKDFASLLTPLERQLSVPENEMLLTFSSVSNLGSPRVLLPLKVGKSISQISQASTATDLRTPDLDTWDTEYDLPDLKLPTWRQDKQDYAEEIASLKAMIRDLQEKVSMKDAKSTDSDDANPAQKNTLSVDFLAVKSRASQHCSESALDKLVELESTSSARDSQLSSKSDLSSPEAEPRSSSGRRLIKIGGDSTPALEPRSSAGRRILKGMGRGVTKMLTAVKSTRSS